MCDYSLHAVATRPAEVGEALVSTKFRSTTTRGFACQDNPEVAVCLRPGTEIAFDGDVPTRSAKNAARPKLEFGTRPPAI